MKKNNKGNSVTVIGGGFAGTTAAYLLQKEGYKVTLLEKDNVLGGGCRTYFYGGHPFTYGPRVYYGYSTKVFEWLNKFVKLRLFPFELKTYVEDDNRFYTYPIHTLDLPLMKKKKQIREELKKLNNTKEPKNFEEYWINRVGKTLYNMFVNQYSKKMWMVDSNKIFDIFKWSAKDKAIETDPSRVAYKGSYLGYPIDKNGYNFYFDEMVKNVKVVYNAKIKKYNLSSKTIFYNNTKIKSDIIISTIPIDELLNYKYGELPYAGRDFSVFILPAKQVFPGDVRFCHYAGSEPHTRITEFKKITYYDSEDTLMVKEVPSKRNKLYPYLAKKNIRIVEKYSKIIPKNVFSIGRLGTYKYSTIEQTIVQAFNCVSKITGKNYGMQDQFFGIGDTSMMKNRKEKDSV
jgi:UDP-galactopyranose mutase